jgi:hypothetical protein
MDFFCGEIDASARTEQSERALEKQQPARGRAFLRLSGCRVSLRACRGKAMEKGQGCFLLILLTSTSLAIAPPHTPHCRIVTLCFRT